MRQARPSAIAVLPTPASPTSSGLFLRRRHRIWITRSTSCSRPISGSILPSRASWFRFCVNWSSGEPLPSPSSFSASVAALPSRLRRLGRVALLDAVGDEVDDVEARHALLVQVVDGVRILLAEDRDQHVGAGDFLLAAAGRLHVHDRALDHALEAERRLRVDLVGAADGRRVLLDEAEQALAQVVDVGRAGAQHLGGRRVVEQRHQQVLDGDEFVALLACLDERHVQADFQFLGNHAASIMHCKRMAAAPRGGHHQFDLRRGDVLRVDAADAAPFMVNLQHDLRRGLEVVLEVFLQHHHDELHRRVVVVEQHDLVHRRRLGLRRLRSTTTAPCPSSRAGRVTGGAGEPGLSSGMNSFYRVDLSGFGPPAHWAWGLFHKGFAALGQPRISSRGDPRPLDQKR